MSIATTDYLFGPPSSLTVGGAEIGPSEDPATLTITETTWGPDLQGSVGQVAGLMRVTKVKAELATKLNNLSLAMLQVALHGVTPTVGTAAVTAVSGLATTLAADAAAGATSIVLTAATNIADNKFLKVGDVGEEEIVKVDPSWTAGTTIPLTTPLLRAHDSGDAVVMVDDAGTTILRQRIGFIPTTDHKDVIMQAVGPDGTPMLVTLFDCLNTAGVKMAFADSESAGTPVTFTAYADITDPTLAPYAIERLTV
jgi:hypothetical protein